MSKKNKSYKIETVDIDDIPTGVLLLKRHAEIPDSFVLSFINQAASDLLQLKDGDHYREPIDQFLNNEFQEIFLPLLQKAGNKFNIAPIRRRATLPGRSEIACTFHIYPIEKGLLILIHELSEQCINTRELLNITHKYRSIFESSQDVFYQTDLDGTILEVSPSVEKYTGYSRGEMIGENVYNYYTEPEDRNMLLAEIKRKGRIYDHEVRFSTKNMGELFVSINAHLTKGTDGNLKIEGALRNITSRKKAENKLQQSNEKLIELINQRDKLFSVISHDLKNALAGPSGLYDLILEDFDELSKEQIHEYLTVLNRNTKSALELLMDLLVWSKNKFKDMETNFTAIELEGLIEEVIDNIQPLADEKGIVIENRIDESCNLTGDRDMVKTILRNLLNNAIKFSESGQKVAVSCTVSEKDITLSVSDSGVGMTQETIQKIFDKSINHTSAGTNGEKGSGLGLDLCIDFVDSHNGKIWAESTPGSGSTFYVTLPKEQPEN
jgi:PAS domain S-box-containing protein